MSGLSCGYKLPRKLRHLHPKDAFSTTETGGIKSDNRFKLKPTSPYYFQVYKWPWPYVTLFYGPKEVSCPTFVKKLQTFWINLVLPFIVTNLFRIWSVHNRPSTLHGSLVAIQKLLALTFMRLQICQVHIVAPKTHLQTTLWTTKLLRGCGTENISELIEILNKESFPCPFNWKDCKPLHYWTISNQCPLGSLPTSLTFYLKLC